MCKSVHTYFQPFRNVCDMSGFFLYHWLFCHFAQEGRTPLQCAADNNHDEVVDLINGAMAFHNSTGKPVCGCGFFEWVNGTL